MWIRPVVSPDFLQIIILDDAFQDPLQIYIPSPKYLYSAKKCYPHDGLLLKLKKIVTLLTNNQHESIFNC